MCSLYVILLVLISRLDMCQIGLVTVYESVSLKLEYCTGVGTVQYR